MREKEKYAYNRYVENRRIEMAVLDTAEEKGKRKTQIQFALDCLAEGLPFDTVVRLSRLLPTEVQLLAEGNDIDADPTDEEEEDVS